MARAGDVFHNPVTGEHAVVLLGADDTDGRYTAYEVTLPAGGGLLHEHEHPELVEAVRVRCGRVRVVLDGEARELGPGERVVVARGVRHDVVAVGEHDAEVVLEVWPGRRFEALACTLAGIAREGRTDERGMPDPLQLAVLAQEYAREIRFASRWLRPPLLGVLARLGRLGGIRPSCPRHLEPVDRVPVPAWPEQPEPGLAPEGVAAAA